MTIEEEIKQNQFQSEFHKAAVNVIFTGNWLSSQSANRLKPYGLSPEQYNVLRILRGSHPKPMKLMDIAARMLDKNSNGTRLVDKLIEKGLALRDLTPANRRQVDISITTKGLTLLKKIDVENESWSQEFKSITETDLAELNRLLDKLRS